MDALIETVLEEPWVCIALGVMLLVAVIVEILQNK